MVNYLENLICGGSVVCLKTRYVFRALPLVLILKKKYVIETPIDLHDIQAFLFESSEVQRNSALLGKPLNQIKKSCNDRIIFSEYHRHGATGSSFMIRKDKWKYIFYKNAKNHLFNLESDHDELNNLSDEYPEICENMYQDMLKVCYPFNEHQIAEQFINKQISEISSRK